MRRYAVIVLAILCIPLLSTCNPFDPQWVGIWVDDETVPNVTITFDLGKDEGTVTVENSGSEAYAWLTIVTGSLDGDEDTLIATIRSIYQENNDNPTGTTLTGFMLLVYATTPPPDGLGLAGLENSVSYSIVGDTITLKGELITVITEGKSPELEAVKQ